MEHNNLFSFHCQLTCLEIKSSIMSTTEGIEKKPVCIGPWGGPGGECWDDGVHSTIRQLVISHGVGVDSIQIEYDQKGTSVWSEKRGGGGGGGGGNKTDTVKFEFPNEFLISINGTYGNISKWSPTFIRSLSFQSNKKTYGPFGVEEGTNFSHSMEGGKIVGFHGRADWYLDSIGVYMKSINNKTTTKTVVSSQVVTNVTQNQNGYKMIHGSLGNDYDIVLALRQKEDSNHKVKSSKLSKHSSSSSSSDESSNDKKVALSKKGSGNTEGGAVSYGPWGGGGGSKFDDGVYTGIRQINITRSTGINSIRVFYDMNKKGVWGSKLGGTGGIKSEKIVLDHPNEILTHVSGYYGPLMYMGPNVIKSITFHTTKNKYGPYGDEQGTPFNSNLKEGVIVGFFGRGAWFIDSIGVHVIEGKIISTTTTTKLDVTTATKNASTDLVLRRNDLQVAEFDNPQWSNKLVLARKGPNEEVTYGVVKEPVPFGAGPWGGDGGKPWDDGVFTGIKQVFIIRREAICSIQIEYDRNGQSVWSGRHGGSGETTHKVKFEYPHEVVTCISGYYGIINRDKVIRSLTFYTSRGKYGPYGEEVGTFFTSTTTEGKVVGFHGRSSLYLDAIGVHMQHWLGERRSTKSKFTKMFG